MAGGLHLGVLLWLALGGCDSTPSPATVDAVAPARALRGEVFGTTWSASWRGGPDEEVAGVAVAVVLEQIDRRMSSWRADSELQAVRAGPGPVPVHVETFEVVDAALDLARDTGGAFDPTVEPLMELWGFRGERRAAAPSADELAAVRERVGWMRVQLSHQADGEPTVDAGGTALDLSAIAKGHAVDRVSAVLSRLGAADHMVEIGGEVRAHGSGPSGGPWRLGVDAPEVGLAPGERLAAVVALTNGALATSGNYRNAYDVDGLRVVHTMDPRTGRPHESTLASVTVIAADCRTADGWATAVMVLGPEDGLAALEQRPELEGLLIVSTPEGFRQQATSGMAALLVTDDPGR